MKKILSGILAAAVACGSAMCLTPAASAAEDNGYALSVAFDKAEVSKSENLTMTISLDENPGLVSVRFQVQYDPEVVTIENTSDITALEDFGVPGSFTTPKANNETGNVTLRWSCPLAEENITVTGELASIKFTVSSDAAAGSTGISIVPIEINMIDEDLDFIDLDEKYGTGIEGYCKTPSETDVDKLVKVVCAHTWNAGMVTTEPTCTQKGVKTFTCTICGETKTEEIDALGHTWDNGVVTTEPTCTQNGVKTLTCTVCGETKTEVIEASGHTWDDGAVTVEPTCTEAGVKTYTCTVCNETKTEEIPALGHNWSEWTVTKEPTSDEEGEEVRECSVCGEREIRAIEKLPAESTKITFSGGFFVIPETNATSAAPAVPAESETVTAAPVTTTTAPVVTAAPEAVSTTADTDNLTVNTESNDDTNTSYDGNVIIGNITDGKTDDKNSPTGVMLTAIPAVAAAAGIILFKKKK